MPEVKPFHGIVYNPGKVSLPDVIAPPYDVITSEQQTGLYHQHPANIIRLILGREENRYASAAQYFSEWRSSNILIRDENLAMYVLSQNFALPDGQSIERKGFIAACTLEDFGRGSIFPHEKTLSNPKEDRFRLFQSTKAMFSQIFSIYSDPTRQIDPLLHHITEQLPYIDLEFEQVRNQMWKLTDANSIALITSYLRNQRVFVADGHHRYETALLYRDSMRLQHPDYSGKEAFNFVPMFFTNMNDPGLIVLPTHRLVHSLPVFNVQTLLKALAKYFTIERKGSLQELLQSMEAQSSTVFGAILGQVPEFILLKFSNPATLIHKNIPPVVAELDVTVLHSVIIKDILGMSDDDQAKKRYLNYVKDPLAASQSVQEGKSQAAFLLNATKVEQVRNVAEAGYTMPQKSTYFYPKLLSGMVTYSFLDS